MPGAIVTPTNCDMLAEIACVKSVILVLTVYRRPLAYFCILNQNVSRYVYFNDLLLIIRILRNYYGAPIRIRIVDLLLVNQILRLSVWCLGMVEFKGVTFC